MARVSIWTVSAVPEPGYVYFRMDVSDRQTILAPGDMLGCYRIVSFLGQGGFGVTYLARDTMLDIQVAIKEYLPERIAERADCGTVQPRSELDTDVFRRGLANFLKEARTLARFNHPNIVRVMSVFELNETAYMVMEYERGHDLKVILNRRERINESFLKTIIGPVLDGLNEVHRHGFIHRDIKPANILVRDNGTPVLLDFGSARLAVGNDTEALTAMVTAGFAPLEQYSGIDDQQGPWTDVYALGAVMYYAITGSAPPDSTLRGAAVLNDKSDPYQPLSQSSPEGYSRSFCRAVDWALHFRVSRRPQSLDQWRSRLFNDESADDTTVIQAHPDIPGLETHSSDVNDDTYEPAEPALVITEFDDDEMQSGNSAYRAGVAQRKEAKRQSYLLLGIAAVILIGALGVVGFNRNRSADDSVVSASAPSVTQSEQPGQTSGTESGASGAGIAGQDEEQQAEPSTLTDAQALAEQEAAESATLAEQAAERAEVDRIATESAARQEADRAVQRAEARRQAQLQERREAEIVVERQRQVALSREAERQAEELLKEEKARAAADLAFERNAVTPLISDKDFADVLSRFNALSTAIRQRDSVAVKEITVLSDRKTAYFDYVFRSFDRVEVDVIGISASRQDQTIRAILSIKRMIRSNGDIAIPPEEFRNIPIYSVKEEKWSAIYW